MRHLFFGLILFTAILPTIAFANPVLRSGDSVTVGSDQAVDGDLYGLGGSVVVSGAVNGDAYIAGGTVTINAPIMADVAILGGTTQIHADVADDVRVVGGEVTLAGTVTGDVFVLGGVLRILSTASVEGDILFFGGELLVEGPITGAVFGYADTVRIDAFVGGDVELTAEHGLTLGDRTEIQGDVVYTGHTDVVRAQNAVVVGDIQHEVQTTTAFSIEAFVIPFFMLIFAGLTMFLVFRKRLMHIVPTIPERYGLQGLIGLAAFFAIPFTALILIVSVLGMYVGILLFALYVLLVVGAWILAGIVVGTYVMHAVTKRTTVSAISVVVGTVLLQAVLLVPYIGALVALAVFFIVFGWLVRTLYRSVV